MGCSRFMSIARQRYHSTFIRVVHSEVGLPISASMLGVPWSLVCVWGLSLREIDLLYFANLTVGGDSEEQKRRIFGRILT